MARLATRRTLPADLTPSTSAVIVKLTSERKHGHDDECDEQYPGDQAG